MFAYIVRRLFLMLVTLFGISVIIFVLLRVVPGNIVDILFAAAGYVDPADKANLEKELGIDRPLIVQYWHWISGFLRGDFGYSYVSDRPEFRGLLVTIGSISAGIGVVMPFELAPFFFDVRGEVMMASVMLILLYPFTILGFCLLFLLLTRSSV